MMDFVANDSPWLFGLEPSTLSDYLKPFGLRLVEDVGNAFYQKQYLQPMERTLDVTEGERVAQAIVMYGDHCYGRLLTLHHSLEYNFCNDE